MNIRHRQFNKQRGSALILVVVVTVLLAAIGTMFLMVSRLSEMETAAVTDGRDLDAAVQTIMTRIDEVLVDDLFGRNGQIADADDSDEAFDFAGFNDLWLASLEPLRVSDNGTPLDPTDDQYNWPRSTDLYGTGWPDNAVISQVIMPNDPIDPVIPTFADADGDGVSDSIWVRIHNLSTSRGEDVYAAVRIIDNCAMLNLNTAQCFYQGTYADNLSLFEKTWYQDNVAAEPWYNEQIGSGWYLTEINYLPFLRGKDLNGNFVEGSSGGDFWYNLMVAKSFWNTVSDLPFTPQEAYDVVAKIENPGYDFQFFGIGDELEIRNRFLLTSPVEARFEQPAIANFTLDAGGATYGTLETPVDDSAAFISWKIKMEPDNFDKWTGGAYPYRYDRRHVCTFYSFDRLLRKGDYPLLTEDFALLAATKGWTSADVEKAEAVFWPVGAVTTDIHVRAEIADGITYYNSVQTRRRILHLLFALRDYFYDEQGMSEHAGALKAAQVVANLIDYSDDEQILRPISADLQGPFYDDGTTNSLIDYGGQANVDCTYIDENIIQDMIQEVSEGWILVNEISFGLDADDVVFGYERQPFISEVYADWDEGDDPEDDLDDELKGFAVELVNPYPDDIILKDWKIQIGTMTGYVFSSIFDTVPGIDSGRQVIYNGFVSSEGLSILVSEFNLNEIQTRYFSPTSDLSIKLMRPDPRNADDYLYVDMAPNDKVRSILNQAGQHSLQRDDDNWKFIYNDYAGEINVAAGYKMGTANTETTSQINGFQLTAADNQFPVARWNDLEVLSLFGNGPDTGEPNNVLTTHLDDVADAEGLLHFDLENAPTVLDYLCTLNRPNQGTLPGRININTAPVHVIAAAIPPALADPNIIINGGPSGYSALDLAQDIVDKRPYAKLSDLLLPGRVPRMTQFTSGGAWADENVGIQSIENDIEERHWVLSNLANKFTVRSDVFTAYILVRLGSDGPQRRMLAIIDRSNVQAPSDRPNCVALHPVPDPR